MLNTIRVKILAVAVALLAVFAVSAGISTYLVGQVVEELDAITLYQIPFAAHIAEVDALSSEFELQLRRAIPQIPLDESSLTALRKRHSEIGARLADGAKRIEAELAKAIADPRNDPSDRLVLAELRGTFTVLGDRLPPFVKVGNEALAAVEAGDQKGANMALARFVQYDEAFDKHLAAALKSVEALTLQSITETSGHQLSIRRLNGLLFLLATVFGLGLFLVLTQRLQRSLGTLLAGTQEVETGRLDVALPVTSRDEIGKLTEAFNRMVEQLQEKEHIKDTFGKYLDPRIVPMLIAAHGEGEALSERRPATLFFSDIAGFSAMSEHLTASAMVNLLNGYFSVVTKEIRDKDGIIDKFIGDAVMAFWTMPFSADDRYAADACLAALAQQTAIEAFRRQLPQITGRRRDSPHLDVRMGLATGEVVIGTIGSDETKSYTVIGDVVNIASRLEGLNKTYGTRIIVDDATLLAANGAVIARELDRVNVVGKTEPLSVHELVCRAGELPRERIEVLRLYAAGLSAYRAQEWDAAEHHYTQCLALDPGDGPSRVLLQRVRALAAEPPPGNWDGVWQLAEK